MKWIVEMFSKLLKDGHCMGEEKNQTNLLPLSKIDRTNYLLFVAREPVFKISQLITWLSFLMKKVEIYILIYGKMRKQHPVRSATGGKLMLTKEAI
jgi:hypothetical protein